MGLPRRHAHVKLIAGLLSSDADLLSDVKRPLEHAFRNRVDFESEITDFGYTDFYRNELGPDIKRRFYGFERLIAAEGIYKIKLAANAVEKRFCRSGKRTINIDPGYLDLSKVVLFSTKDYTHRIYLDKGIFAEATLFYQDRTFNAWPWTYPDYKTSAYIEMFNQIRERYKRALTRA